MHLEILVEERSAEPVVRRLAEAVGVASHAVRVFEGKPDLLGSLGERLRGYIHWGIDVRVLVLVDRDDDDCRELKQRIEEIVVAAGMPSKSNPAPDGRFVVCSRIACEELEAWFLGDEAALRAEFPKLPAFASKAKFRQPDAVTGGTWEALERLLQRAGYYRAGLAKVDLASRLAPRLSVENNNSPSFRHTVSAIRALTR